MRGIDVFCERCGARQPTESRERTPASGKFARRLASAVGRTADGVSAPAPEMFLRLCLECRGYSCPACWNEEESRCQTCAPLPVVEPAQPMFTEATLYPIAESPADAPARPPSVLPPPPGPFLGPARELPPIGFDEDTPLDLPPIIEIAVEEPVVAPTEPVAVAPPEDEPLATEDVTAEEVAAEEPPAQPTERVGPPPVRVEPYTPPVAAAEQMETVQVPVEVEPEPEPVLAEVEPQPEAEPWPMSPSVPPFMTPPATPQPEATLPFAASGAPAEFERAPDPVFPAPEIAPRPRPSITFDTVADVPPPAFTAAMMATTPPPPPPPTFAPPREYLPVPQRATATTPPGVKPCRSCQLPLSAKAHFCRRCGTSQES